MGNLALFFQAMSDLMCVEGILILVLGVIVGIFFGAVPGLSAFMAVALFVPVTYGLETAQAFRLLVALYVGGISGGLIASIMLNIPGSPASIATCFDGSPMAKKGLADKALGAGVFFSFVGSLISFAFLIFLAPTLAKFSLKFSSYEYFAVVFFAMTMIIVMSSGNMIKGLFSGVLGLICATVGAAPVTTTPRYTFGTLGLYNGFTLIVVLLGVFALKEVLTCAEEVKKMEKTAKIPTPKIKGFGITSEEMWNQKWNAIRSGLIGTGIGILPGIGASTAGLVSYVTARRFSKCPEKFGTGIIDGVVASETANNAVIGGALIPLMALGIPGDGIIAMILGAFMIHGLTPGPLLFATSSNIVYGIFAACVVSVVIMLVAELGGMRIFIRLLDVPKHILMPLIIVMCVIGAFAANNVIYDVYILLFFAVMGYFLAKAKLPVGSFVLAFILGKYMEEYLLKSLMYSTEIKAFYTRPICAFFLVAAILFTIFSCVKEYREWANKKTMTE